MTCEIYKRFFDVNVHYIHDLYILYSTDDSDHYYESLDPAGNAAAPHAPEPVPNFDTLPPHLVKAPATESPGIPQPHDVAAQASGGLIEEDYDSFDSEEESDEEVRKNDSGVDVSNNRLPDPPTPTNQVYAFMQKIRNFGSLSKNLSKFSKKKSSKSLDASAASTSATTSKGTPRSPIGQSTYENTQFYVNVEVDRATKPTRSRSKTPSQRKSMQPADLYENAELHAPFNKSLPAPATQPPLPATPEPLIELANTTPISPIDPKRTFGRKKSSSGHGTGKSLKSKFRKSLGPEPNINLGSSFNGKRSTFYVTDSTDMDSGVFTNPPTHASPTAAPLLPQPPVVADKDTKTSPLLSSPAHQADGKPEATQRKSSLTVRPLNPPPPPPIDRRSSTGGASTTSSLLRNKRSLGTTSWYAECGVFKSAALDEAAPCVSDDPKTGSSETQPPVPTIAEPTTPTPPTIIAPASSAASVVASTEHETANKDATSPSSSALLSTTSAWFVDPAGVYQTSGASVASSSNSSGVSTGGSGDDHSHSMFLNEPLYQIYSAAKLEVNAPPQYANMPTFIHSYSDYSTFTIAHQSISHDIEMDGEEHSDGYEEVGSTLKRSEAEQRRPRRPTALQLVGPKQGPSRTLWCEIPEVINSQILCK